MKKGVLKNFTKFADKQLCQSIFFNKVAGLGQHFLHNNSGQLLLECGHCKNKVREINCLRCREVDAMLIASAKIQECEGRILYPAFIGVCLTISYTC